MGRYAPSAFRTAGGQLISFSDPDSEARFRSYTGDLLSGAVPAGAPTRFWARDYPRKSERILIKDLHAKALIDWFDCNFDLDIIYFVRHPIPQAMSCIRNGWGASAYAYLQDPAFADMLGSQLKAYGEKIMREGTLLERHVLTWALENYMPLQLLPNKPHWLFVSYEQCVLEPDLSVQQIANRLDLSELDRMHSALNLPSNSSKMSLPETRNKILLGETRSILGQWRDVLSDDDEKSLLTILDRFEVPLYRPHEDLPQVNALTAGQGP